MTAMKKTEIWKLTKDSGNRTDTETMKKWQLTSQKQSWQQADPCLYKHRITTELRKKLYSCSIKQRFDRRLPSGKFKMVSSISYSAYTLLLALSHRQLTQCVLLRILLNSFKSTPTFNQCHRCHTNNTDRLLYIWCEHVVPTLTELVSSDPWIPRFISIRY